MKTFATTTFTERLGQTLGRLYRAFVQLDRTAKDWLVARGMAPRLARATLLLTKAAALGLALYTVFWLALVLLLAAAAWTVQALDLEEEQEPEWRIGAAGFGLYRGDVRIDVADSDEDET